METVSSSEKVARILNPEWIEDGILMHEAFMLRDGETYISVNRPSVDSYDKDVTDFINKHPDYAFDTDKYKRALLGVGEIRDINVAFDEVEAKIDVEVEPRDAHYKSHAGIFTRLDHKNLKKGQLIDVQAEENVSADSILLEVRMNLLDISTVEQCEI